MPALEVKDLNQKAVLWVANGNDTDGEIKVDAKVEINVRWEDNLSSVGGQGSSIAIAATVVVDRDIAVNDIMWLGALRDVPATPTNLRQVADFQKIPNVKGRNYRRTVSLVKYSNELPTLA